MHPASPRAVFLDRDGVIIENRADYVRSIDDVQFLPGALPALRQLADAPYTLVIITNQSAVGRGFISIDDAAAVNRHVVETIESHGGRIDAWYMCPHAPADGCDCRKPAPGMVLRAGDELKLDLAASVFVGDAVSDLEAAWAVGMPAILVRTGRGNEQAEQLDVGQQANCKVVADLPAAVQLIVHGTKEMSA